MQLQPTATTQASALVQPPPSDCLATSACSPLSPSAAQAVLLALLALSQPLGVIAARPTTLGAPLISELRAPPTPEAAPPQGARPPAAAVPLAPAPEAGPRLQEPAPAPEARVAPAQRPPTAQSPAPEAAMAPAAPPAAGPTTEQQKGCYLTVTRGLTLGRVAVDTGLRAQAIMDANPSIGPGQTIYEGQQLLIPPPGSCPTRV